MNIQYKTKLNSVLKPLIASFFLAFLFISHIAFAGSATGQVSNLITTINGRVLFTVGSTHTDASGCATNSNLDGHLELNLAINDSSGRTGAGTKAMFELLTNAQSNFQSN